MNYERLPRRNFYRLPRRDLWRIPRKKKTLGGNLVGYPGKNQNVYGNFFCDGSWPTRIYKNFVSFPCSIWLNLKCEVHVCGKECWCMTARELLLRNHRNSIRNPSRNSFTVFSQISSSTPSGILPVYSMRFIRRFTLDCFSPIWGFFSGASSPK